MERRAFIAIVSAAAVTWPLGARAQQTAMPVVGFLNNGSADAYTAHAAAFQQGLGEAGFTDGQNVAVEYRWANGDNGRLPALVAELVGRPARAVFVERPESGPAAAEMTRIHLIRSFREQTIWLRKPVKSADRVFPAKTFLRACQTDGTFRCGASMHQPG